MTQKRYNEIPKRQKCINKEEPYIGGAVDIVDDTLGKPQSQVNQERIEDITAETQRAQQAEGVLDGKVSTEKQRAEGVEGGLNTRLQTVEQLAEISIGGGDAQIATGSDFTNPDATKRAKIPTVGAIVDGLNDGVYDVSKRNPSGGPNSDGKFTLEYILSNADTLIPISWRHGGMIISFVDSSDNKYIQYRYMSSSISVADFTNVTNWQGVDAIPTPGSLSLVESGGIALQDYEHNYALVLSLDVPSYDSTNKTLTLKEGSLLIHPNIEYNQEQGGNMIVLNDDVAFTKPDSAWGSHYLILNTNTLSTSFVSTNTLYNLSQYEIPIALIRWNSNEILDAGFNKYIKDGVLTDIISNNPDSVKQVYRGEFALVTNYLITINTTSSPKSLTIPSGAIIVSPNVNYITLSTSVTLEKPNTSWNSHYVIYNSQSNSLRAVQTNVMPIINSNECLICIIRWSDGYIINSNQSGYYIDDILMDAGGVKSVKTDLSK